MVSQNAPTVRLMASITAIAGVPPVTISAFFLASRPLEMAALDAYRATLPEDAEAFKALPQEERRQQIEKRMAALVALFDASCVGAEIRVESDREPRPCGTDSIDDLVKVEMALKLVSDREVSLNERGQ